ncbi:hypothetical protein OG311_05625 [Streptomyces sp. NBC_01343]|uniref:hypothetical protein n=1 Tax=Streptomyces sp. NBC_01343 TaxID=2903832 RepID=UPI002E12239B|nr:hypothetical protein OG311_05625 [Streptomyces sp. NBC_01343]
MQLRRALPLSLVALLASAGCVCVGPEAVPAPARDSSAAADAQDTADASAAPDRPPAHAESLPLPLGRLPEPPAPPPVRAAPERPPAVRGAEPPAAPRRARPAKPAPPRTPRQPAAPRLPRPDELCAAAEGAVPPSIVDLCIRQYGR